MFLKGLGVIKSKIEINLFFIILVSIVKLLSELLLMYSAFFIVTELIHRTSVDGFGQVPYSNYPF